MSKTSRRAASASFVIRRAATARAQTRIVADAATCEACLDDLFDPASRFHLYPFVNCTHCGPRYTLTRRLPYDRAHTSMAPFAMCADCARDYHDPANRRFHAEPIACPACGPQLRSSPAEIVAALRAGEIVALKGIGGFHLLCDARNDAAVDGTAPPQGARRQAVRGDGRPMSPRSTRSRSATDAGTRSAAGSSARPIVLMQSRGVLADAVAPALDSHRRHAALYAAASSAVSRGRRRARGARWRDAPLDLALVATSANPGGDPLVIDDDEAQERLAAIADLDRRRMIATIVTRADDSAS